MKLKNQHFRLINTLLSLGMSGQGYWGAGVAIQTFKRPKKFGKQKPKKDKKKIFTAFYENPVSRNTPGQNQQKPRQTTPTNVSILQCIQFSINKKKR